jgi:hypothetical protein
MFTISKKSADQLAAAKQQLSNALTILAALAAAKSGQFRETKAGLVVVVDGPKGRSYQVLIEWAFVEGPSHQISDLVAQCDAIVRKHNRFAAAAVPTERPLRAAAVKAAGLAPVAPSEPLVIQKGTSQFTDWLQPASGFDYSNPAHYGFNSVEPVVAAPSERFGSVRPRSGRLNRSPLIEVYDLDR